MNTAMTAIPRANGGVVRQIRRTDVMRLVGGYVLLTSVFVALGKLLERFPGLLDADQRANERIAAQRTPTWDRWSWWGSEIAGTIPKIVATAIATSILFAVYRRWRDVVITVVSLGLEAAVFLTTTLIVKRPRPVGLRMETSPVDSSFPSGHTAAAAAYTAFAVVAFWHSRRAAVRIIAVALAIAAPIIVGLARFYRGMHHLTDVGAGAVLGLLSVAFVAWMISSHRKEADAGQQPDSGLTHDLLTTPESARREAVVG